LKKEKKELDLRNKMDVRIGAATAGSPEVGLGNNYDQPPARSKLNSFHQKQKHSVIFFHL
jgi:hypothetical protein